MNIRQWEEVPMSSATRAICLKTPKVGLLPITGESLDTLLAIDNRIPQDPYDEPPLPGPRGIVN